MEAEDLDVPGELQKMDVSKAYLKLNTGEVIELDKYQGVMIREDSIRIANADYTLRYSYDSVVPLEVLHPCLSHSPYVLSFFHIIQVIYIWHSTILRQS